MHNLVLAKALWSIACCGHVSSIIWHTRAKKSDVWFASKVGLSHDIYSIHSLWTANVGLARYHSYASWFAVGLGTRRWGVQTWTEPAIRNNHHRRGHVFGVVIHRCIYCKHIIIINDINSSWRVPITVTWLMTLQIVTILPFHVFHQTLISLTISGFKTHSKLYLCPWTISMSISGTCHRSSVESISASWHPTYIGKSILICIPPTSLSDLFDCYNSTLSNLLRRHTPVDTKRKPVTTRPINGTHFL